MNRDSDTTSEGTILKGIVNQYSEDSKSGKSGKSSKIGVLVPEPTSFKDARYKQDTELKKGMAIWVKWLVAIYLVVVSLILIFSAYLKISDAVMIALLTTTTINVLGLSYMVVQHLFPQDKK